MHFNILSRPDVNSSLLATRMEFDSSLRLVKLERFVFTEDKQFFKIEHVEFYLSESKCTQLLRDEPTSCKIRLNETTIWEFRFETYENCRTFAKESKCRVSIDGEYLAKEERAIGFEVQSEGEESTLLILSERIFFTSKLRQFEFQENVTFKRNMSITTNLIAEDEVIGTVPIDFPTRAARERFLGYLTENEPKNKVKVFTGTWNVGKASPPTAKEIVRGWIELAGEGSFDVYVFALQECSKKEEWDKILQAAVSLHSEEEANKVGIVSMREVQLMVYSKNKFPISILGRDVRATGIANTIGNKGAVGIGLNLEEFGTLALVSAHLSAFQDNIKRRAQDHSAILRYLSLIDPTSSENDSLEHFERVIFMGDLNYRIDMGESGTLNEFSRVEAMSRGGRWMELAAHDQLTAQMNSEKVFFSFQEAKPIGSFPPTYKMKKGEQGYCNKKDQNPSFTDRVLFRGNVSVSSYGANHELVVRPDRTLTLSDHRPVYSAFEWEEADKSWYSHISFEGPDQKDIMIHFSGLSYKLDETNNENKNANVTILEESILYDLEDTPRIKFRLSGFGSSSTSIRRSVYEDDDKLEPPVEVMLEQELEYRILSSLSTCFPSTNNFNGSNGVLRSFSSLERLRGSEVRIGIFSPKKKEKSTTVGYTRFTIPKDIVFDTPILFELPIGSRGCRNGNIVFQMHLSLC